MKKSITFRLITRLGIKISEGEYYDVSFFGAINRAMNGYWKSILLKYCMYSIIFSPFNYRFIRPYIWRKMGSKVGKNVFIGYGIWLFTYTETGLDGKSNLKNHGVKPKSLSRRQL